MEFLAVNGTATVLEWLQPFGLKLSLLGPLDVLLQSVE